MTPLQMISSIQQRLEYDQDSGLLYWRRQPDKPLAYNARWAGRPAFTHKNRNGFLVGLFDKKTIRADRIAWAIRHGEWRSDIYHADRDGTNNRILNLRCHTYRRTLGFPPDFYDQLVEAGIIKP